MAYKAELFVALQRVLPKQALSRLVAKAAESTLPWLKNALIKRAIKAFNINMDEALTSNLDDYKNFNSFFTRELKSGVRPIDLATDSIASPADGTISQAGKINKNKILQAKGIDYTAERLLGNDADAKRYYEGNFATIYLSPRDYHRVHIPLAGKLLRTRYIPGSLFSVNDMTAQALPGLFSRNERLVCEFESDDAGTFAVIFVGAILVAGIETVWSGFETPGPGAVRDTDFSAQSLNFMKGDEIGRFKFGSTVILLFKNQATNWECSIDSHAAVQMGQKLGSVIKAQ
tara:strand:- start:2035 stop:2898 length:864 start_codon:yes stop_codon:yes gene_type:complete